MRKKPKPSGPLNLAPEHRVSPVWSCARVPRSYMRPQQPLPKVSPKVLNTRPFWPLLTQDGWPLLLLLPHYLFRSPTRTRTSPASSRPLRLISGIVISTSHSFSSTLPPTLILIVTHHTLHRISGIDQRGTYNRAPVDGFERRIVLSPRSFPTLVFSSPSPCILLSSFLGSLRQLP